MAKNDHTNAMMRRLMALLEEGQEALIYSPGSASSTPVIIHASGHVTIIDPSTSTMKDKFPLSATTKSHGISEVPKPPIIPITRLSTSTKPHM